MIDKSKTYALALEGGGFKGAYQAGALKALKENNIKLSAVAGTSIGSINAAFVAMKKEDELEQFWKNIELEDFFEINTKLITFKPQNLIDGTLLEILPDVVKTITNGGFSIKPLKEFLSKSIDEDLIRKSDIRYGLITFSMSDFKPMELMIEDIPEGQLIDFIIGSCYFPVFKQEKINGKFYIDGGVYNNLPTAPLSRLGYQDIIEIRTKNLSIIRKPKEKVNIVQIKPHENVGGIIRYNKQRVAESYELGYCDCLNRIEKLDGEHYFIKSDLTEREAINELLKMEPRLLKTYLEVGDFTHERMVLCIFPEMIRKELTLDKHYSYKNLYISLLELLASEFDVNKYKLYDIPSFKEAIKKSAERAVLPEHLLIRSML